MAMTIMNDASVVMTLGELNKNISQLGKQLKKVSSGQRINSAGDGPSEYSISEKMRVRLRALKQDERNVQNGASLLRVAEGGIQQQLEIMKTIKEKVIDADNDTNTDLDRMTIQKEIDQGYQQIETIAWDTNYNGKRLLVGNAEGEAVRRWIVSDTLEWLPESDKLDLIPDLYDNDPYVVEDGGKYDKFQEWSYNSSALPALGLSSVMGNMFQGGKTIIDPTRTITFDLSGCSLESLNNNQYGVGFMVKLYTGKYFPRYFVLTQTPDKAYNVVYANGGKTETQVATNIAVNPSMTKSDIAQAMADAINNRISSNVMVATADGEKVTMTLVTSENVFNNATDVNRNTADGFESKAGTSQITTTTYVCKQTTGVFSSDEDITKSTGSHLSGGRPEILPTPENPDAYQSELPDTLTANVSSVTSGMGVRLFGPAQTVESGLKLAFIDGNSGYDPTAGTIGKSFNGTATIDGFTVTMDGNGKITFSAPYDGHTTYPFSKWRVADGLVKEKQTNSTPIVVDELKSLTKLGATNTTTNAKDSDVKATFTMDLTSYADKYNESDMESFISELKGKVLQWEYYLDNRLMEKKSPMYGFVDSHGDFSPTTHKARSIEAVPLFSGATALDLNELRGQVSSGKSVADVATTWLKEKLGDRAKTHNEDNSIEEGKIVLESYIGGTAGNRDDVHAYKGTLRSYTIDFASALAGKSIPDDLDGKGFRVYCATHQGQWFNIEFVNGLHNADSRPRSGAEGKDVKTLLIDVSQVHNANDLAAAIYDQAQPVLTSGDPYWDHYFRLAADTKNGTLTIYDNRTRRVNTSEYTYQIDGAKIADGVIDNISEGVQHLRVNDLIIHHTDRASMNIRVRIPQTTMDHLFGYESGTRDLSEFNVLTAKSREELLGNKPGYTRSGEYITEEDEGLLDKAIKYLTNANCLVGAQISRLQMTESNIVTSHESTQSSESTIRDADMAMEMANYTKSSVLAQAAQSMLAQANQNSSGVLSLLQ